MRKIQLQSGKIVRVGCKHDTFSHNDVPLTVLKHMPHGVNEVRGTVAYLKEGDKNPNPGEREKPLLEVVAYCSPLDNFSRRVGRRVAAMKLLEKMRETPGLYYKDVMSLKLDRKNVFLSLCPEYAPPTVSNEFVDRLKELEERLKEVKKDGSTDEKKA